MRLLKFLFFVFVSIFSVNIGYSFASMDSCSSAVFPIKSEITGSTIGLISYGEKAVVSGTHGELLCLEGNFRNSMKRFEYKCHDGEWNFVKKIEKFRSRCIKSGKISISLK